MTDLNRLYKDRSGAVFGSWLRNLKDTLGGRGRMGSLVGLSEELRKNLGSSAMGPAGDAALSDYAVRALLLMACPARLRTTQLTPHISPFCSSPTRRS